MVECLTVEPVGPGSDAPGGARPHAEVVRRARLQPVHVEPRLLQVTVQVQRVRVVVVHLHLILPALPRARACKPFESGRCPGLLSGC